jgi:hypothetical protein
MAYDGEQIPMCHAADASARFEAETAHGRGWAAAGAARIGDWDDGDGLLA